jgi:hypothetical protein
MNDQLDHRLRAFVHEEFDRDVVGIRDQLAGEKREQFRSAPVSGPRVARGRVWPSLSTFRRPRGPRRRLCLARGPLRLAWRPLCGTWRPLCRAWRRRRATRRFSLYLFNNRFAKEAKLVVERAHDPLPFAPLGLRLVCGIGPGSMSPFSAKSRRTVSEGCAPFVNHSRAFSSSTTTVRGSVRGL